MCVKTFLCEIWQIKTKTMTHRRQRLSVLCWLRWRLFLRQTQQWNENTNFPRIESPENSSRRGARRHPTQGAQADPHRYCGEAGRNQWGTLDNHQVHLVVNTDLRKRVARNKGRERDAFFFMCTCHPCIHFATQDCWHASTFTCSLPHLNHDGACNSLQLLLFSETKKCIPHVFSVTSPELVLNVFPLWECFARWKKSSPHQYWPQSSPCSPYCQYFSASWTMRSISHRRCCPSSSRVHPGSERLAGGQRKW